MQVEKYRHCNYRLKFDKSTINHTSFNFEIYVRY